MGSSSTYGSEWGDVRGQVLERDEFECRFCGVTNEEHKESYGSGLHAHHLIPRAEGGEDTPQNLITVCNSCHRVVESTQADALARIKQHQPQETTAGLEQKMHNLRFENDVLRSRLQETKGDPETNLDVIRDAVRDARQAHRAIDVEALDEALSRLEELLGVDQ